FRPLQVSALNVDGTGNLGSSEKYVFHRLDLRPREEEIFRRFHKSCIQRKIRRAQREGLAHEEGRSEAIVGKFYHLLQLTRRRHVLPPQPLAWFRNLIDCIGERLTVHIASKDGQPLAGILTLSFKTAIVYKYGCSNDRYHNLGGMPFLLWKAIQEAKRQGLEEFDLGRSEADNSGLITFKDHLGASKSTLTYYRYPASAAGLPVNGWKLQAAQRVFVHMPDPVLAIVGKLLYRHIG
ncbi:MAG: GNAT family N-acetyltransferase, partial [Acidobacteria bacterium]|nr:GNAT family N-acetyltransferase [Acidobacteriota bacterium]